MPLAIDLFCGMGGWTDGLLATGWRVIGFDITRWPEYPGQLVLQDVLTIDGRPWRGKVDLIVASPPCTEPSYRAMPWSRAKALNAAGPPHKFIELFNACFRISAEAGCPIVVENVKGAQPWVGRAKWHYGSFYLWGDVPALMPQAKHIKVAGFNFHQHQKTGKPGGSFQSAAVAAGVKNDHGGSWFGSYQQQQAEGRVSAGRMHSSKSHARRLASAKIAKIPFELSRYIGECFYPCQTFD